TAISAHEIYTISLHDALPICIIDGDVRRLGEGIAIDTDKIKIVNRLGPGFLGSCNYIRTVMLHLAQEDIGVEYKHTAVPVIAAGRKVLLCCRQIRLLDKLFNGKVGIPLGRRASLGLDVTIAGFRVSRLHTKGGDT